jgi:nucleotide-binding universal stress UspA family protein
MNVEKIVVGFDGSAMSAAALQWAAEYSSLSGAQLVAVHTWEMPSAEAYAGGGEHGYVTEPGLRADAESWLAAAIGEGPERGTFQMEIVEGPAGPVLVSFAHDATLLVVGTREHTGLRRLVSGSVSHYCLSHATCPVVAVPGPVTEKVRKSARREPVASVGPLF